MTSRFFSGASRPRDTTSGASGATWYVSRNAAPVAARNAARSTGFGIRSTGPWKPYSRSMSTIARPGARTASTRRAKALTCGRSTARPTRLGIGA